jgi:lysophospholipase L1-like esterase
MKFSARFKGILLVSLALAIVLTVLLSCLATGRAAVSPSANSHRAEIICFGDSITLGIAEGNWKGEHENLSFPGRLQRRVKIPVINAGIEGNTTTDALYRLTKDVISKDPRIVVVFLGANDFLQSFDSALSEHNFNVMMANLYTSGRKIYMAPFLTDEMLWQLLGEKGYPDFLREEIIGRYAGLYTRMSQTFGAEIITDVWRGVWPANMTDNVHPNLRGYQIMADNVFAAMRPYLEANGFAIN